MLIPRIDFDREDVADDLNKTKQFIFSIYYINKMK